MGDSTTARRAFFVAQCVLILFIGRLSTITGTHDYSGGKWNFINVSDVAGIALATTCLLTASYWAKEAVGRGPARVRARH